MMRYLRELCIFLKSRAYPRTSLSEGDCRQLESFFKSELGRKLIDKMIFESFEQDRSATVRSMGCDWACGVATGFRLAVGVLQSFTPSVANADNTTQSTQGAADLRERLAPK